MIRSSIVASAIVTVLFCAGCEKRSEEQRLTSAEMESNQRVAAAQREAQQKIANAQAEAEKKVAAARADFADARENFRHYMVTELVDVDQRMAALDARLKTSTGKAKADLDEKLKIIRAKREAVGSDFKSSFDRASAVTWEETKDRLDKELAELRRLIDGS